jgi:hypothetical protein
MRERRLISLPCLLFMFQSFSSTAGLEIGRLKEKHPIDIGSSIVCYYTTFSAGEQHRLFVFIFDFRSVEIEAKS